MQTSCSEEFKDETFFSKIYTNYQNILHRVNEASVRSGRHNNEILTVAVTKYAEPTDGFIDGLLRANVFDLAENRPQKLVAKTEHWCNSIYWDSHCPLEFVSPSRARAESERFIRWHFIGKLQRNKIRKILPHVSLIHSVDSWKLLESIDRILQEETARSNEGDTLVFPNKVSVLLEVHISEDETKQGFSFKEVQSILPRVMELSRIKVVGLMGMAGLKATPNETRRQFANLRRTLETCQNLCPELVDFKELSMGMSGDFEIAVEEGSTIVRIGSVLYPNRE